MHNPTVNRADALGKNNRDKTTPKPTPKIARMINTWLLITLHSIDAEIGAGSTYYLSSPGGSIVPGYWVLGSRFGNGRRLRLVIADCSNRVAGRLVFTESAVGFHCIQPRTKFVLAQRPVPANKINLHADRRYDSCYGRLRERPGTSLFREELLFERWKGT